MKISKRLIKYSPKYLKEWETEEPFKDWLTKREINEIPFCPVCEGKLSYKEVKIALDKLDGYLYIAASKGFLSNGML